MQQQRNILGLWNNFQALEDTMKATRASLIQVNDEKRREGGERG